MIPVRKFPLGLLIGQWPCLNPATASSRLQVLRRGVCFAGEFERANLKEAHAPTLEAGSRRSAVAWAIVIAPIRLDTAVLKEAKELLDELS